MLWPPFLLAACGSEATPPQVPGSESADARVHTLVRERCPESTQLCAAIADPDTRGRCEGLARPHLQGAVQNAPGCPPVAPRTELGDSTLTLEPDVPSLHKYQGQLRYCGLLHLPPGAEASIHLAATLQDGRVTQVELLESSHPELADCAQGKVSSWRAAQYSGPLQIHFETRTLGGPYSDWPPAD